MNNFLGANLPVLPDGYKWAKDANAGELVIQSSHVSLRGSYENSAYWRDGELFKFRKEIKAYGPGQSTSLEEAIQIMYQWALMGMLE